MRNDDVYNLCLSFSKQLFPKTEKVMYMCQGLLNAGSILVKNACLLSFV